MAQSVECPTLAFDSVHAPRIVGLSPQGLGVEPAWESLSPSLCPSPRLTLSRSQIKKKIFNKNKIKGRKKNYGFIHPSYQLSFCGPALPERMFCSLQRQENCRGFFPEVCFQNKEGGGLHIGSMFSRKQNKIDPIIQFSLVGQSIIPTPLYNHEKIKAQGVTHPLAIKVLGSIPTRIPTEAVRPSKTIFLP